MKQVIRDEIGDAADHPSKRQALWAKDNGEQVSGAASNDQFWSLVCSDRRI